MLLEQTQRHIGGLTDEDLLGYIRVGVAEYEPDAVAFAKEEFGRRNLSHDQVVALEQVVGVREAQETAAERQSLAAPLGTAGRVFAFIAGLFLLAPLILFVIAAYLRFRNDGEQQKSTDLWSFYLYGVFTVFGFFILSLLIFAGINYFSH